jgi:MYXO-CTERM domain-containing protein
MAGNIVLTGHDNDFHCGIGCTALGAEVNWARAGSSLPVLSIDAGSELQNALTTESIPFVNVNPAAVTAGMFDHSVYSAFVVASVTSCGGCDNPAGTGTHLATFEAAISAFFDAGGGIVGLAGAQDLEAYAYAPKSGGTLTPIGSRLGFVATPTGIAGIPGFVAANGDTTHNTFANFDPFYHVAEVFTGNTPPTDVTIFGSGSIVCTGTHCHVTPGIPEPSTWTMMGLGFAGFGLIAARARRRRAANAVA